MITVRSGKCDANVPKPLASMGRPIYNPSLDPARELDAAMTDQIEQLLSDARMFDATAK